jgi:glycosyltransferase involved in cell wall biosynthesis
VKIALITPGYPSEANKYNLGFVHTRVKNYQNNNVSVDVFVTGSDIQKNRIYEGVEVFHKSLDSIIDQLNKKDYDGVFIHFINDKLAKLLSENNFNIPFLIWVHGTEALSFRRRMFNLPSEGIFNFLKYALWNLKQRFFLNKYIELLIKNKNIGFIFPSNWMMKIAKKDLYLKFPTYKIIPNPIDNEVFKYIPKENKHRFNIISIKSFRSYKYGTDILQKIILKFLEDNRFEKYKHVVSFDIFGDGTLFNKHTKKIKEKTNVNIHRKFLTHKEMTTEFSKNGIFINTTRQDAQGVTMCEAMMSGLVVLSSKNTAIPEFIDDKVNGVLCNSIDEFVDELYNLLENPLLFKRISNNTHNNLSKRLSIKNVIDEELDFLNDLINRKK